MTVWKVPADAAAEGGWAIGGAPDSFSTRDRFAPKPVLRPILTETPNPDDTVVGVAGWLEEFDFGPFEQVTCEGTITSSNGLFTVRVTGSGLVGVYETVPDLFEALSAFKHAIISARKMAQGKKQAMGTFEGKESTYYELVDPSFFMELTERGAQRLGKEIQEQWRRENYADWGSW